MSFSKLFKAKNFIWTIFVCVVSLSICACEGRANVNGTAAISGSDSVEVYYVNNDETAVISRTYTLTADIDDTDAAVKELLEQMETMPQKLEYEAPINGDIVLNDYSIKNGVLTLDFDAKYNNIDKSTEILDRAAMVRTLCQVDKIDYVSFTIDGSALKNADGTPVGNMSSDMFIYNAGNEINTYEKVQLKLYFANEQGDGLIPIYRTVVYNSNISMERLITEQIIKGPNTDVARATVNPETAITSVTVRDGTCYVDLDEKFMTEPYDVAPRTVIYSLVNSLAELSEVNRVQISVNGDTTGKFMDAISLSSVFERDLDIIDEG